MASVSFMSQFGPGLVRAVPLVSKASQALPILWARACRRSLSGTTNAQLNEDARSMMGATGGVEGEYATKLGKLFDLTGRVAFITGAGRGVGAHIAHGMARFGAKVVITDVNADDLEFTAASIRDIGGDVLYLKSDVRDRKSIDTAMKAAADKFGSVDIAIANAGILGKLEAPEKLSEANWDSVFAVNAKGALNTCQAAYPYMKKGGSGKIIIISSIAGVRGFGMQAAYCASKGALLPLCKSLAVAWGRDHINVNCILPGATNTGMVNPILHNKEKVDYILKRIPVGRLGVAEDYIGPAVFLASHASDYITGSEILVDGGGLSMAMVGQQHPEDFPNAA